MSSHREQFAVAIKNVELYDDEPTRSILECLRALESQVNALRDPALADLQFTVRGLVAGMVSLGESDRRNTKALAAMHEAEKAAREIRDELAVNAPAADTASAPTGPPELDPELIAEYAQWKAPGPNATIGQLARALLAATSPVSGEELRAALNVVRNDGVSIERYYDAVADHLNANRGLTAQQTSKGAEK